MNKQYKLVKCYPGSPELGVIVENRNGSIYFPETNKSWSSTELNYFDKIVTNNPEFWEQVIEKEFEILELSYVSSSENVKIKYNNGIPIVRSDGKCVSNTCQIKEFTKTDWEKYIKIISIKRLSDNTVFTIGDRVKQSNVQHNNIFTITGFCLDVNRKNLLAIGNGGIKISKIEHYKPLFTTEDGKPVFEGDNVAWVIRDEFSHMLTLCKLHIITCLNKPETCKIFSTKEAALEYVKSVRKPLFISEDGVEIFEGQNYFSIDAALNEKIQEVFSTKNTIKSCFYRYFSTKEKAEEYILLNKPCLSINDIKNFGEGMTVYEMIANRLKELVKSKI